MTLLYMDSFERYVDTTDLRNIYGSGTLETSIVKNGLNAIDTSSTVVPELRFSNQNGNQLIFGAWFYLTNTITGNTFLISFYNSVGSQLTLIIDNTNKFRLYRGFGSTLLGTSVNSILIQTWYFLELKVKVANSIAADDVELRINGVTFLTLAAGTDTQQQTASDVIYLTFYSSSTTCHAIYDDIYLCNNQGSKNNNFLGPIIIDCLKPNGNGASSQWDGSDGNQIDNYLLVDDLPRDTGTYIEAQNVSEIDLFNFEALSERAAAVHAVKVSSYTGKMNPGSRILKTICRIGGVNYEGNSFSVGQDADMNDLLENIWELNPNGSVNWTGSTIGSAEFGVKVEA